MSKKVIVIGSGFAGLSSASFMAKAGWDVTIIEKLSHPGGRARQLKADGFTFDMGPSWYWMPDVFEHYFSAFGKKVSDFYSLKRLDPSYKIYWQHDTSDIPADINAFRKMLESWEPGAAAALDKFLIEAKYKYEVGMQKLVYKPGLSIKEFIDVSVVKGLVKMDLVTSIKKHISRYFSHEKIRQLLEFPVLFLGAMPEKTPALYSLMNYADIVGGTWYPQHGMHSIVDAMHKLAVQLGVKFRFDEPVTGIKITAAKAESVVTTKSTYPCDAVIGAADYHFIETKLLPKPFQSYTEKYWDSRTLAPSSLLYYIGVNKKIPGLTHHSLFFDTDFQTHGKEIYDNPQWPENPLFYVSATSVTDPSTAPENCENLFFLIPVAAGLNGDDEQLRKKYFNLILNRFEKRIGISIKNNITFYKSFAGSDFVNDYNSFKGNAYGLANTLKQTAILKPSCRSKKVKNLFYAGQLTVPGPGVPPSLISGEVVSEVVIKNFG
ncbi:MAG: phytoene desaturase [Gemmatimonadaceae bacterium]|nr:phytoene desaturase [Chitinophagaceae bacterium]